MFHESPRILLAAVKFFLGQDEVGEGGDSDDEGEDGPAAPRAVNPTKAEVYSASKKVRSALGVFFNSNGNFQGFSHRRVTHQGAHRGAAVRGCHSLQRIELLPARMRSVIPGQH